MSSKTSQNGRFPNTVCSDESVQDPSLEEATTRGRSRERIDGLSTGSKIVIACGTLLFSSLFFVWQNLEIDFGQAGTATQHLDGWDVWGLLMALVVIALVSLVVVVRATDVEVSEDVDWELVTLALAVSVLGLTLLKNLTDADSAWASYVGLALAAGVVLGAGLDWSRSRDSAWALPRRRRSRRRVSRAA